MGDLTRVLRGLAVGALAALAACGGEEPGADVRIPPAEMRPKSGVLPEKTAARPDSPCGWLTAGVGEMRSIRARGGLGMVGVVDRLAEGADTLEGPWDEVAIGVYGQLAMLTGDRMLEMAYLTSSTDIEGVIRLAGTALPRLASAGASPTAGGNP